MKLTIGATVNLEHYENLRVEVQEEMGAEAGITLSDLVGTLVDIMQAFGRNEEHAKAAIDSYCCRILGMGSPPAAEQAGVTKSPEPEKTVTPEPKGTAKPAQEAKPSSPPVDKPTEKEVQAAAYTGGSGAFQGTLDAGATRVTKSGGKCDVCKVEVPMAVWIAGMTFLGRGLCKTHLDEQIAAAEKRKHERGK